MSVWNIKVLYLGKITMPFSTMLSIHYPFGAPSVAEDFTIGGPYLGFLLQRDGHNILVDTGISAIASSGLGYILFIMDYYLL